MQVYFVHQAEAPKFKTGHFVQKMQKALLILILFLLYVQLFPLD